MKSSDSLNAAYRSGGGELVAVTTKLMFPATSRPKSSVRRGWSVGTCGLLRPKVERKLAHLMRRRHGGRRARVRGRCRVGHDFSLLAAAVNVARMAVLGAHSTAHGGWAIAER